MWYLAGIFLEKKSGGRELGFMKIEVEVWQIGTYENSGWRGGGAVDQKI